MFWRECEAGVDRVEWAKQLVHNAVRSPHTQQSCAYADGLQYLKKAAELGYNDGDALARDDDFQSLRDDAKFQTILTGIRSKS